MTIYRLVIITLFMAVPLIAPGVLVAKPYAMHQSSLSIDQKNKQTDAAAHPALKKHALHKHSSKHVAKHAAKHTAKHSLASLKNKQTTKKLPSDEEQKS